MFNRFYQQFRLLKIGFKLLVVCTTLLISSCNLSNHPIQIPFELRDQSKPVTCKSLLTNQAMNWQLAQLQFFLHDVYLKDTQANWHRLHLPKHENNSTTVALLGGVCPNSFKLTLAGISAIKQSEISAVKFKIGVPNKLNHNNPITQNYPLNQANMFWVWQTGHKYFRLELSNDNKQWAFHLGATGCESKSPVRPPQKVCQYPNIVNIELSEFSVQSKIAIQLDQLLAPLNLAQSQGCQSSLTNPDCSLLFKSLNLDGSTTKNTVFKVLN
ncbi:MbnP family copper-binding protein [Aliikangiella sp. IMCC44632]